MKKIKVDHDEQQRRLLQEYIFNLEDIQEEAQELSVAHERLKQSQNMLMAVVGTTTHGLCILQYNTFTWCNDAFLDISGWKREELIGKSIGVIHRNFAEDVKAGIIFGTSYKMMREYDLVHKDGYPVSCLVTGRILNVNDPSTYVLSIIDFTQHKKMEEELRQHHDHLEEMIKERTAELLMANEQLHSEINERKRAEAEREKLIAELREALTNVKMLSGLLPICSACKKIRNDKGYWEQIECYIRDRSDADFTHGICPDCKKKLYPNF